LIESLGFGLALVQDLAAAIALMCILPSVTLTLLSTPILGRSLPLVWIKPFGTSVEQNIRNNKHIADGCPTEFVCVVASAA
jgi:hypothetical protein